MKDPKASLELVKIRDDLVFSVETLKDWVPDVETAFFVGKLYKLNAYEMGTLLYTLFDSNDVVAALTGEGGIHSEELQDYILELGYEFLINAGKITFDTKVAHAEVLPEVWASLELTIAKSIEEVGEELVGVVDALPGKKGQMLFKTLATLNAKRPTIGAHKAQVHHAPQRDNLLIFDVSGSMSEATVETMVKDVVALGYMANAWLAVVSDTCTYWGPGEYNTDVVLAAAEYSGTHYETLAELMQRDWGVVVCIADYDSAAIAKGAIAKCRGHIQQVLDISLVTRPTFLSEVVGQLADEVRPLLVAQHSLTRGYGAW